MVNTGHCFGSVLFVYRALSVRQRSIYRFFVEVLEVLEVLARKNLVQSVAFQGDLSDGLETTIFDSKLSKL